MDRFGGARYPGYTLRRFYPTMAGYNLSFAPSQYGATGTQREKSGGWDIVTGLTEFATGIGTEWVRGKFEESRTAREIAAEQARALIEQQRADAEARRIALTQPAQAAAKQTNYLPWVLGGLGVLAAITVGGIVLSKPRRAPAAAASSSRRASRKK